MFICVKLTVFIWWSWLVIESVVSKVTPRFLTMSVNGILLEPDILGYIRQKLINRYGIKSDVKKNCFWFGKHITYKLVDRFKWPSMKV